MLNRLASGPLLLKDLIKSLSELTEVDENTVVEIKLKNEYNAEDKKNFMSSEYCFVAYFNRDKNKVVIQNFV